MPESPDGESPPTPDPDGVGNREELLESVRLLIGPETSSASVARRARVGESTVYAFRAGRGLSKGTFDKLVFAHDPDRRAGWAQAWKRASASGKGGEILTADDSSGRSDPVGPDSIEPDSIEPVSVGPDSGIGSRRRLVGALIAAVLLVTATGFAVGLLRDTEPEAEAAAVAAPGSNCPQPPLQTAAPVTFEDGAKEVGVSLAALSYTYFPADSPMIEIGGGLSGPVPAGQRFFMLSWSDPASTDSTPGKNPGNGRYYPVEIELTADHCFLVPRGEMGYVGFTGMVVRHHFVMVPTAYAGDFERAGNAKDGFTQGELAANHVLSLGYLTVQTT